MEKLFSDSELFTDDRPNFITNDQREKLLDSLVDEIISHGYSRSPKYAIKSDLDSIVGLIMDDGYEIAKDLDDNMSSLGSYKVNSCFVEWCECIQHQVDDILSENVRDWVKAKHIEPKFKAGDLIKLGKFLSAYEDGYSEGDSVYIKKTYSDTAQYGISKNKDASRLLLINYERIDDFSTKQKL